MRTRAEPGPAQDNDDEDEVSSELISSASAGVDVEIGVGRLRGKNGKINQLCNQSSCVERSVVSLHQFFLSHMTAFEDIGHTVNIASGELPSCIHRVQCSIISKTNSRTQRPDSFEMVS